MSDRDVSNSGNSGDVLSSLPSTRPQRRSPKRDGAKQAKSRPKAASGPSAGKAGARKRNTGTAAKPRSQAATPRRQSARAGKPVAAQGYQAVSDTTPVEPPTGAEILASAVQATGDMARFGLTLGERLLRAAASRLPKP